MGFGKRTRSYVGVDIGQSHIRIAQVEPTAAGFRVEKMGVAPTPPDTVRDGLVTDVEAVGGAIRQAIKEAHVHTAHAVLSVSGGTVFVRTVEFPKMTPQMLRDSIRFEAGRFVPGSVEEAYVEGEIVGNLSETAMSVLLVAAPRELVDGRIAACSFAGLDVEVVEVDAFATYRALLETDPSREVDSKTILLVDIGAGSTSVSIVDKGTFVLHRSIPHAGNTLTEVLKQAFKLETQDAEAGKQVLDLREILAGGTGENPPLKVIQSQVDDLIRELRRSMNFLQSQTQNPEQSTQVDFVVLCGGGAQLAGLDAYVQARLGVPTQTIGIFDNGFTTQNGAFVGNCTEYAVAAGLAMRGHAKAA